MKKEESKDKAAEFINDLNSQKFYHGTKANLKIGDLIEPGLTQTTARERMRFMSI